MSNANSRSSLPAHLRDPLMSGALYAVHADPRQGSGHELSARLDGLVVKRLRGVFLRCVTACFFAAAQ